MGGRAVGRVVVTLLGASTLSLALMTASGVEAECSTAHRAPPAPPVWHLAGPPPQPQVRPVVVDPNAVTSAVQAVSARATVGLLTWDRATGEMLAASIADQQFRSASLVKLLIAIDTLAASTDPTAQQRVERMLRDSNDSDASILWGQRGGAELVSRNAQLLGLAGAAAPDIPGRWGNTLLTANDLLTVYRQLLESLPTGPTMLNAMRSAPRLAADGFDQHFGIPTAFAGQPWAVKQGWGNSSSDVFVHTTGLVGAGDRYVVVLLTSHPRGTPFGRAAASVTAGATALAGMLSNNVSPPPAAPPPATPPVAER
jgi:hypothetical protein